MKVGEPFISAIEALQAAEHGADHLLRLVESERNRSHGNLD